MENTSSSRPCVVLTGASVGIGYELARLFAHDGYELALVARNAQQLEKVAAECLKLGAVGAQVIAQDLAAPHAAQQIFQKLDQRPVDVLVNNAGFGTLGSFASSDLQTQLDMLQVNIVALTELTHLFVPAMLRRKKGRILNVASTAAFLPGPLMAVYYASKAYVLSFSQALASELSGSGVTVTALCPGPTATEFQKRARAEGTRLFKDKTAMSAAEVANAGYRGMNRGRRVVVPGASNRIVAFATRLIPRKWLATVSKKMNTPVGPS